MEQSRQMRTLSIQMLTPAEAAGYCGDPNGSVDPGFACRFEQWLHRYGAALGCVAVVLSFIGAVDLVRHAVALL
jgi:hypothetical protein